MMWWGKVQINKLMLLSFEMNDKYQHINLLVTQVDVCAYFGDDVMNPEGHSWTFPAMCYHSRWSKGKQYEYLQCLFVCGKETKTNSHRVCNHLRHENVCGLFLPSWGFSLFSFGKVLQRMLIITKVNVLHNQVLCCYAALIKKTQQSSKMCTQWYSIAGFF